MNEIEKFNKEIEGNISAQGENEALKKAALEFMDASIRSKYSYNFTWLGRPIIQYPQDIVAIQEIIYMVQPDFIIETGIAHGGSLIFHASICELIGKGEVLGIDIDIRKHNKAEIEAHKMSKRISMLQGSSIDPGIIEKVREKVQGKEKVLVILDSNHTHAHVLEEIRLYAKFVTVGSYLMIFDTIVEHLPDDMNKDRPWSVGNNPKTAVLEFLRSSTDFEVDKNLDHQLMISVSPGGYLKRIK
ncbi:MAG TPA: cephalosporin hydroxylase family protein [Chitinophagaceae bacterium]|nr:cephalosporin hydroxylase family protein [Chitinophagaceae bacterium]